MNFLKINMLENILLKFLINVSIKKDWKNFIYKTKKPKKTQKELLISILENNKNTEYGKKYQFQNIYTIEDFQRKIPLNSYNSLEPFIDKMLKGQENVLTKSRTLMFATTSGTTGKPKYIPINEKSQKESNSKISRFWSYNILKKMPESFNGKILTIVSPAVEGYTEGNIPYGAASGHIMKSMNYLVRRKYAVPYELYTIEDYDTRNYLILLLSFYENTTMISTANPSSWVLLATQANRWKERLINDIRNGTVTLENDIDDKIYELVK